MSSIYKKGRDGYFYYQAYIYNEKSGKKNKRVFHALRTKNREEALKKKKKYDLNYKSKNQSLKPFFLIFQNSPLIKLGSVFIILFFIATTIIQRKQSSDVTLDNDAQLDSIKSEINIVGTKYYTTFTTKEPKLNKSKLDHLSNGLSTKEYEIKVEQKIPRFHIKRIEKLPGKFQQGKLHVIVDDLESIESIKLLCEELRKSHDEFINVIICIYSNTKEGNSLAKGKVSIASSLEEMSSWLAMYTYNPIEGAFFDSSPMKFHKGV